MKQTPYRQNTSDWNAMHSGRISQIFHCPRLGLFSLAWMSNILTKKAKCYQKYGLASYLASCSASLSTRETYLATTDKLKIKPNLDTSLDNIQPGAKGTRLLVATSLWTPQEKENSSYEISPNSYVWAQSFSNGLNLNKSDSFSYVQQNDGSVDEASSSNGVMHTIHQDKNSKISAFKLSRDYISSDSSEGFEDWSFLDQKRPYDSLVRENIFELLDDLEKSPSNWNATHSGRVATLPNSTIHENSSFNVGFEEHLFSSEINKTYTNRLRLEQRIKQFYGLSSSITKLLDQKKGGSSSYDILLQLEKRIDVQLFRLNWASSIAHARQILKHKHIGIINCKDRLQRQINHIDEVSNVAASNLLLKVGDLLYWRDNNIFESVKRKTLLSSNDGTLKQDQASNSNAHKFPWLGYIGGSETFGFECEAFEVLRVPSKQSPSDEDNQSLVGISTNSPIKQENTLLPVFALASEQGSINLANDTTTIFTHLDVTNNIGDSVTKYDSSLLKLSKYFETHYKYSYAIRTSQDLKLEYLRLPQSSIQKNEWKAFLESSI